MQFHAGKDYRAKTVTGDQVTFRVIDNSDRDWPKVDLEAPDGPEPNVWLNKSLLVWVSAEEQRSASLTRAAEEVIDALEGTAEEPLA